MKAYRDKSNFTISFDEHTLPIIEQISEGMPGGFFIYHADGEEELAIRKAIDDNILKIYEGKTKLLISELKDADAAVLGASALGWEVRDARCNVFEGFIDFLSAERLGLNDGFDSVVLNSVANVGKALTILPDYSVIACYLDNDEAGRAALARLRRELGDKVMDKSALYPDHKDLNEFLVATQPKVSNNSKLKL